MELSLTFPTVCLNISIDSHPTVSQDSVVGTATSCFSNPGRARDFLFSSKYPDQVWGPTCFLFSGLFPGGKMAGA